MRAEACEALAGFIREYGKSIINMPSSCQIYLAAKLSQFPAEKELLTDALRRGIPERILQQAGTEEYMMKLAEMSREIAKDKKLEPEVASGVVMAWAEALNRPVGYQKSQVPDRVYNDPPPPDPAKEKAARIIMALIAGAGGFLGSAIGAGLPAVIMLTTEVAVGDTSGMGEQAHKAAVKLSFVLVAIRMAVAAGVGGPAAMLGWWMGGGNQRPWAGFAAAFGTGFGLNLVFIARWALLVGPLVRVVCIGAAIFGATYTAAARGGHKV